ncbi:MAG: hypothetical protein ACI915_000553 [Gammaproteobacteria bacterium]|jgi:hypothetical protein
MLPPFGAEQSLVALAVARRAINRIEYTVPGFRNAYTRPMSSCSKMWDGCVCAGEYGDIVTALTHGLFHSLSDRAGARLVCGQLGDLFQSGRAALSYLR